MFGLSTEHIFHRLSIKCLMVTINNSHEYNYLIYRLRRIFGDTGISEVFRITQKFPFVMVDVFNYILENDDFNEGKAKEFVKKHIIKGFKYQHIVSILADLFQFNSEFNTNDDTILQCYFFGSSVHFKEDDMTVPFHRVLYQASVLAGILCDKFESSIPYFREKDIPIFNNIRRPNYLLQKPSKKTDYDDIYSAASSSLCLLNFWKTIKLRSKLTFKKCTVKEEQEYVDLFIKTCCDVYSCDFHFHHVDDDDDDE